jgi:UDP-N-acetylglucosamine acyltransferase
MALIHPSSMVHPRVELAEDVEIGPGCVLDGPVSLGQGTRLIGNIHLVGRVVIGCGNVLYPHVCIGFEPQDRKYDPRQCGGGVMIGDNNVIREGVTIHRASGQRPTTVGNDNYLMAQVHVGHDVVLGNQCTLANGTLLGGYVTVEDKVNIGGYGAVHQFCRVGRLAMLSGLSGVGKDLPPFCISYVPRRVESLNLVGLRRAGHREHIPALKNAFRILYMSNHTIPTALQMLEAELGLDPLCRELIIFVQTSKRGITGYRTGPTSAADGEPDNGK